MSNIAASAFFALLGVLPSPRVDVGAFASAETGGGYLPVNVGVEPAAPAMEVRAVALGAVRLEDDGYSLVLRAGPQLYAQAPNAFSVDRPLLYLTTNLGYQVALSRRLDFTVSADAGAGELSYTALTTVFDPGTSPVDAAVVPLVAFGGTAALTYRRSARHTLTWSVTARHQQTFFAIAPEDSGDVIEKTDTATLSTSSAHSLTKLDQVTVTTGGGVFSGEREALSAVARLGASWRRRLSPRDQLGANGGLDLFLVPDEGTVQPIPMVGLDYLRTLEYSSLTASIGLRGFFDRIAVTYTPQFFTSFGASRRWSPDFESRASLFFSTVLQDREDNTNQFGTNIGIELPSSYALSRTVSLTFGVRASLSAPPLWEEDWSGSQAQAVGFVGIAFTDGTGPGRGNFVR